MSEIKTVFGTTVIIEPCPEPAWYRDPTVIQQVQNLIQQKEFDGEVPEQQGQARSTVMDTKQGQIAHRPYLQPLMRWIYSRVWHHRAAIGHAHARELMLGRNWVNEMYKGCSGIVHQHHTPVAVFYLRIPENGADMIFVEGDQQIPAGAKEGDLLIHEPLLWHSVSCHESDISRICLVIEFKFF